MPFYRIFPFLSTSVLFLTFGTISLGTNLFLASWLPNAHPPSWTDHQEYQQPSVIGKASILSSWMNQQPPENDDGDLLHVLTTRFMQHQPDLLALGEARLLLFETFCLPSMKLQTTNDFVWTILTDPDLDRNLLNRLVVLLAPYPHFYLILSNDKDFSFDSIQEQVIITGDVSKLYALLNSQNRSLLLQTRLDADDGLHRRTLKRIQDVARSLPNDYNVGWQIVCVGLHYEWRNDDIFSFNVTTAGKLRLVEEAICVTPGYTLIKHRNSTFINFPTLPRIEHHMVNRQWPECLKIESGNATTDCWTKLRKRFPAALRGRTITSAGMSRIESKPSESVWDNQTDLFWGLVQKDYGILPEQALETSLHLQQHLVPIVEDNLRGQW